MKIDLYYHQGVADEHRSNLKENKLKQICQSNKIKTDRSIQYRRQVEDSKASSGKSV